MERLVVDSNILAASFIEGDEFHERSQQYIIGLENSNYIFHLPMLVIVEVIATISRRAQRNRQALLVRAQKSLTEWEDNGKIILYPLDRERMEISIIIADQNRLRGADSVIAALAEELDVPVKTFDQEILARFLKASV
jgi:predicted nucleic acid-binding protein